MGGKFIVLRGINELFPDKISIPVWKLTYKVLFLYAILLFSDETGVDRSVLLTTPDMLWITWYPGMELSKIKMKISLVFTPKQELMIVTVTGVE